MGFIVKGNGVYVVSLTQDGNDVDIEVNGVPVAFFDADEKEFVVFSDTIAKQCDVTVSVEEDVEGEV